MTEGSLFQPEYQDADFFKDPDERYRQFFYDGTLFNPIYKQVFDAAKARQIEEVVQGLDTVEIRDFWNEKVDIEFARLFFRSSTHAATSQQISTPRLCRRCQRVNFLEGKHLAFNGRRVEQTADFCDQCGLLYRSCMKTFSHVPKESKLERRISTVYMEDRPLLRLCASPAQGEKGRYITLSHTWGGSEEQEKFCTLRYNIKERLRGIEFDELPCMFQDVILVARELGIRYLWVDSLCIIQKDAQDWEVQSTRMHDVYSSAYCTIAATSSKGPADSFLKPRTNQTCLRLKADSDCHLYVSNVCNDFHADVELAELNHRGWILQERALSRRTLHFSENQTYFECGEGIHCETFSKMHNSRGQYLSDPNFPSFIGDRSEANIITLFQGLFKSYSSLALKFPTDRPNAIYGLQERIQDFLHTRARYGVFESYLHRSMIWRRKESFLGRIDGGTAPSWSWMAYRGEITYVEIPYAEVEWATDIGFSERSVLALDVTVRLMPYDDNEAELIFDSVEDHRLGPQSASILAVVLGRRIRYEGGYGLTRSVSEGHYYVLLVEPSNGDTGRAVYRRVGFGCLKLPVFSVGGFGGAILI